MSFDSTVHPGTLWMLEVASVMMRGLSETIHAEYGESPQLDKFLEAAGAMESLTDSIPGARERCNVLYGKQLSNDPDATVVLPFEDCNVEIPAGFTIPSRHAEK